MKIGVITYWQSNDNYGQLLQCWALQHYLRSKGHDAYIIKYDFASRYSRKPLWKKVLKILAIYPIITYLIHRKEKIEFRKLSNELNEKNKLRKFDEFRKEQLCFSENYYAKLQDLQFLPPEAQLYITGSDQVWGQLLDNKENEVFFLNFGSKEIKRISYAASFGLDNYPQKLNAALKANLNRFDEVSVRESSGLRICNNVGIKAYKVMDPTMLLNKEEYLKFIDTPKHHNYIYIYSLNILKSDQIFFNTIKQYSEKMKLSIVATPGSGRILGAEIFDGVTYDYATIQQWISNIANANFVVTTSFHGTVFCILTNTPFAFVPLKGKMANMNNRVLDLLQELNLSARIVYSVSDMKSILDKDIDWDSVNKRISIFKEKSISFLDLVNI